MTTKEIVVAFLIYFGVTTLASSIISFEVYGIGEPESAIAAVTLALSAGFFAAGVVLWRKWEE